MGKSHTPGGRMICDRGVRVEGALHSDKVPVMIVMCDEDVRVRCQDDLRRLLDGQ